jgi:hypothetical protein
MQEQPQEQSRRNWTLRSVWRGRTFIYFALFSLFLTTIPVRSFRVDFSPHRTVQVSTETQKRLTQASDACGYTAPVQTATPAPPPQPVAHETSLDVPVLIVHFDRSSYYRPPPRA